MTDTAAKPVGVARSLPAHPLTPASGEEFLAGRRILAEAGLVGDTVRFAYFGLEEPPKDEVLGGAGNGACDRRLRAFLIDVASGESADVVVSLAGQRALLCFQSVSRFRLGDVLVHNPTRDPQPRCISCPPSLAYT